MLFITTAPLNNTLHSVCGDKVGCIYMPSHAI